MRPPHLSQLYKATLMVMCTFSASLCADGAGMCSTSSPATSHVDKLHFVADWYDKHASRHRHFRLTYFVDDGSVELYEPASRRVFLRRTEAPGVCASDLWLGNAVSVLGRRLQLTAYDDDATASAISRLTQRTFAMIKPDGLPHMAAIIAAMERAGLRVTDARMARLSESAARRFYDEHAGRPFFQQLVQYVCSGVVLGLQLMAADAVARWRALIGPTDSQRARQLAPQSVRARFGTDATLNAVHGSDSGEAAQREIDWFFSATDGDEHVAPSRPVSASSSELFNSSTCVLLLPHAVRDVQLARLLQLLADDGRFEVRALRAVRLSEREARRLLRVYDGVLTEYAGVAQQLSSGVAVAMQVASPLLADSTVDAFRQLAGPRDPAVASLLWPRSLRAQLGVDRIRNGVLCTDLPEDAAAELRFFFGDTKVSA